MKQEGTIYWNKKSRRNSAKKRGSTPKGKRTATPQWFSFTVVVLITFMVCVAINFRAFSEVRKQSSEFSELNTEIEKLTTNNLALQEDIQNLKNDDKTIAREARKIGMSRSNEKVLVPTN